MPFKMIVTIEFPKMRSKSFTIQMFDIVNFISFSINEQFVTIGNSAAAGKTLYVN